MTQKKNFIVILSIILIQTLVKSSPDSDFHSLDGDDRDELVSDQSKGFFLRKELSLTQPYQGSWNLGGSAVITGDYVRLTPDQQSRQGAVWGRLPVHVRNWEVHVNFRVHGATGKYFGDGFAFWYVDPRTTFPGPVFGGQDKFRGLGIFLDTYSNALGPGGHFHPYVSAVVNNGTGSVDHEVDGKMKMGCTARFRNRAHETLLAIRYVDNELLVSTDVENTGWKRCFRLRDLRLPTHFVFGLSAMTGDLSDNHDILYMKVYEIESKRPPKAEYLSENTKLIEPSLGGWFPASGASPEEADGGTFGAAMVIILLALSAIAVAAISWVTMRQRRKQRFY